MLNHGRVVGRGLSADRMTTRLHLRRIPVVKVIEYAVEQLVVAVADLRTADRIQVWINENPVVDPDFAQTLAWPLEASGIRPRRSHPGDVPPPPPEVAGVACRRAASSDPRVVRRG